MKGAIVKIEPSTINTTVIYECNGQRYRGVQFTTRDPHGTCITYYFGGAAHLPDLADIDAALEQGYPALRGQP